MSAFCVFGISKDHCKKAAERKTARWCKELKRQLTRDEWRARADALSLELFESASRATQISPAFDAPQFCREWISLAGANAFIRNPKVMARGQKVDKKGKPLLRKNKPVIGWVPYATGDA